ncbi:MAG: thymidine phosphorylase [Alphaproteobacteria bacterium]|nr:thymidine phosphorylase [Alphaproteobacteria bacterium]
MTIPQELIRKKRDGGVLSPQAIGEFVTGVVSGAVSDAQISAFCMASLLQGLSAQETAQLTMAMAQSGTVLHWGDLAPKIVDKHSTGGVGDKTSLMIAPIVAACGLYVPMIAGRGLGHTGGTIDKLEAIPGFRTALPLDEFQRIVRDIGCAIIGQTRELAPADKRIYAVRDVTATVESVPLITASILSKKLAAGLSGLVIDVKYGNGAFMQDLTRAEELAASLQKVAAQAGLNLIPVLSDMNQVLGHAAGNSVEIIEAVEYLTGIYREPRMHDLTILLSAQMLVLGGAAGDLEEARAKALYALETGRAAEIFARMVAAQGGLGDILENPTKTIGQAPVIKKICADRDGVLSAMNTRDIGILLVQLKAGRARVEDSIDPHVGLTSIAPLGAICKAGETVLAEIHLRHAEDFDPMHAAYLSAIKIN